MVNMGDVIQRTMWLRTYKIITRWASVHIPTVSFQCPMDRLWPLSNMHYHFKFVFSMRVGGAILDSILTHLCSQGLCKEIPEIHLPCPGPARPYEPSELGGVADHVSAHINLVESLLCVISKKAIENEANYITTTTKTGYK